jgi:hypothetical protein
LFVPVSLLSTSINAPMRILMKLLQYLFVGCALVFWLGILWIGKWSAQVEPDAVIDAPLSEMDGVPLTSAIRNLAREMELNIIIDPAVPGSGFVPGRRLKEPLITGRCPNMTSEQEMRALLKENQLVLVTNPVTTVARVAPGTRMVKPVRASAVGVKTNEVVPLIVIDDVPLEDAIRNLARQVRLDVMFDRKVIRAFEHDSNISVRWENLTAQQALTALIDNYSLVMVEERTGTSAEVRFRGK